MKRFSRSRNNVSELQEDQKQLQERVRYQEDVIAKLDRHNTELKKEITILSKEKNDLLNRLSKLAGDQMSTGNPDIVDLSDPNRPTKLAEKWTLLYTDEWLDAYEELQNKSRRSQTETPEKQLLDIVELCYKECQQISRQQISKIQETVEDLENYMNDTDNDLSKSRRVSRSDRVNVPQFKENIISAYKRRRRFDHGWIQAVVKKCANKYIQKGGVHSKRVLSYVYKCAELCWFMFLYDPPLVIEYETYPGQEIDKSKFNLYCSGGNKVDSIIWPALFLNRGDSLCILAKGTVQPVGANPRHLPKGRSKGKENMDDVVLPVSIHRKEKRISSAASTRSSVTHQQRALKHSDSEGITVTQTRDYSGTTSVKSSGPSRIINPERLVSISTKKEIPLKNSRKEVDFFRSHRGKHPVFAT